MIATTIQRHFGGLLAPREGQQLAADAKFQSIISQLFKPLVAEFVQEAGQVAICPQVNDGAVRFKTDVGAGLGASAALE